MPRGNVDNLNPVQSKEEARERGRKGGIRSGEVRRERKTLRQELLALLSQGDTQEKIVFALLNKARDGDTKAFEVVRDTVGEKPVDKIEAQVEQTTINVNLSDDE